MGLAQYRAVIALSTTSGWFGWIALATIVAVIGWVMFRSTAKCKSPPLKTPEAMDAEAGLWSTRSMDQHLGQKEDEDLSTNRARFVDHSARSLRAGSTRPSPNP